MVYFVIPILVLKYSLSTDDQTFLIKLLSAIFKSLALVTIILTGTYGSLHFNDDERIILGIIMMMTYVSIEVFYETSRQIKLKIGKMLVHKVSMTWFFESLFTKSLSSDEN
jgi:hypothetical protein